MTIAQDLLMAAKAIDDGRSPCCCDAIKWFDAREYFKSLFIPTVCEAVASNRNSVYWMQDCGENPSAETQQRRVLALLLAREIWLWERK